MVRFCTPILLGLFWSVLLWCVSFYSYAEKISDSVIISVLDKQIQYGKNFNIYLKVNKKINIDIPLFLQPLNNLVRFSIVNSIDSPTHTVYKLKASALHSGRLEIPSLKWKTGNTQALNIDITQATSSKGHEIQVKQADLSHSPWEREQSIILINIRTKEKNIILNSKNIIQEGIESYLLKHSTKKLEENGYVEYSHTIGWSIYFLYSQKTKIALPEVEYLKNSVPRYKFNFKNLEFIVKKIPVYISPTTPIGKIKLETKYIDIQKPLMQPKSTAVIQYTLTGSGIPAKWLPSIAQLYNLNSKENIQYSHLGTSLKTSVGINNIQGSKTINMAFTPIENGLSPLQNINLQYFNPESNKLETLTFEHEKLLVLNWFFQTILLLSIAYIIYKILTLTIGGLGEFLFRKKHQHLFQKSIHAATSINDIKISLKIFSRAEQWPANISINNWLQRYRGKYHTSKKIINAFATIHNKLYSKEKLLDNSNSLQKIKDVIYGEIKNRKKLPRKNKFNLTYLSRYFPI